MYEGIKTAKDLVLTVMVKGLSTDLNDICRAQDIFGHSTVSELVSLANNETGCRFHTRDTFYFILFKIWHYEDAVRFWNLYTNPEHKELERLRACV